VFMTVRDERGRYMSGSIVEFIKRHWVGYMFLAPFVLFFFVFTVLPVIVAFGTSLTNYNMLQPPEWAGLTNYKLLFLDDKIFITALKNTFTFAFVTGPIGYFLSFLAAWVINQLKMRNAFALAFYAPSITSAIAMSVVWLYFFSADRYGLINNVLINLGVITSPILWNQDPKYILTVVIIISIWMSMGTGFLVFMAGLQNIPKVYYEAGEIDGIKNKFQELFYITLPMMKPQMLFGAINSVVVSFAVFEIAISVAGMPSPNYAGHTLVAHLFDYAFIRFQMGYASAIAMVLFTITFFLGRILINTLSTKGK
jgi:multiple sugar transport system permease protein